MRAALERMARARAAARREAIAAALAAQGVEARVEGDAVRMNGRGLAARWMRDLALREAGRSGR
ncbi:hypothetical protein J3E64_000364 [Sphingobium sp. OAS761]|uniref:hypothetical protein n=1 Tax=Sphingobium sp. OAS761 TaxID=2817901 RepID=UPI0020A20321|nr:hypothetical protein [Sphingobium sp. OAS761]MCP1468697.1 hypothetical protein [Sphingobium sp. OAS761]